MWFFGVIGVCRYIILGVIEIFFILRESKRVRGIVSKVDRD